MELVQLKLFVDMVRVQSFTKVAELNYVTQPAVSLSMHKLEDELGVRLFERTTRKVLVTDEGRILNDYAKGVPMGSEAMTFEEIVEEVRKTDPQKATILEKGFADLQRSPGNRSGKARALLKQL